MTLQIPGLDPLAARELLAREHPGHYSESRFGYHNEPFHWEWFDLELREPRLTVVAPRDTAKSEVFSVATTCWFAERWPGSWQYIFCDSEPQGKLILERVVTAMVQANHELVAGIVKDEATDVIFGNFSRVSVAGVGKRVRTAHPDRVVGDDVLNDASTATSLQRRKTDRWWNGTVAGMAHTGVWRREGWGKGRGEAVVRYYPASKLRLIGTPFHQSDLLMSMKRNPIYRFYRYKAESHPGERVAGTWAVEIS